jgi:hypothetical protein
MVNGFPMEVKVFYVSIFYITPCHRLDSVTAALALPTDQVVVSG